MRRLTRLFLLLMAALVPTTADAGLKGLVVGVQAAAPGAVADAEDVSAALRAVGGQPVDMLHDEQAVPVRVRAALQRLLDSVQPGDLVVFAFAGTGGQQPERRPGSEPDRLDEVFRLGDGDLSTGLRDSELATWAAAVAGRGGVALLVLDTGHVDIRRREPQWRQAIGGGPDLPPVRGLSVVADVRWPENDDDFLMLARPFRDSAPSGLEVLPPRTMVLEATAEPVFGVEAVRPLPDPAVVRGGLSYLFARAIRGEADQDGDGRVSAGEIELYVQTGLRRFTAGSARPGIRFGFDPRVALFFPPPGEMPAPAADPAAATILHYDPARRRAYSGRGDLIAEQLMPQDLDALRASRIALDRLQRFAVRRPLSAWLEPDAAAWRYGERFSIRTASDTGDSYLAVNVTGHGRVQLIFPSGGDRPDRLGHVLEDLAILGPFGTDSVILVATRSPAPELYDYVRRTNGQVATPEWVSGLQQQLLQTDFRLAVLPVVSLAGGGTEQ